MGACPPGLEPGVRRSGDKGGDVLNGLRRVAATLVVVFVAGGVASAQEEAPLTPREQELLRKLDALEQRVEELERRLESQASAPAAAGEPASAAAEAPASSAAPPPNRFDVFWKEGLRFETEDGRFKLRIGGRIQNDWAWFDADRDLRWLWDPDRKEAVFVDLEDGTEFRRARIYLSGEVYDNVEFRAEYDFADGSSQFRDVYVGLTDLPYVGSVRAGHFREPFSMDQLTSSNSTTFMERSLADIFAPARNTGVMVRRGFLDDRITLASGIFRDTDDFGRGSADGNYNFTTRVTGLPWYEDEGKRLLHLGAAYSHRNPDSTFRYRQRPEAHLSSWRFVDTGTFFADDIDLYNAEGAVVYGPFSIQGEYTRSDVDMPLFGDRRFDGYYVFASYFLTGEHRPYRMAEGVFDGPKPKRNFSVVGEERGPGAWEVALRYSAIDLQSGFLFGGEQQDFTVGLNWYLNPNTKWMLNYVRSHVDHDLYEDDLDILQTRIQFMF